MRNDFGVFILSHGRPERASTTVTALTEGGYRSAHYTGRWWIVLDTEDETAPEYEARYGIDHLLTFSKADIRGTFDIGDNLPGPDSVVVYARNAIDRIAADQGIAFYLVLDDDYAYFAHRLEQDGHLAYVPSRRIDDVLEAFVGFLEDSNALTIAFAQAGDFIGGVGGSFRRPILRKAMNTFIVRTGRPIGFVGRINEDVNTYVWRGSRGDLFLTSTDFAIGQKTTQSQEGGLTDAYLDLGTYVKSFYSVMWAPSAVRIATLGESAHRVHHHINWKAAVPKVLSSTYRKARP